MINKHMKAIKLLMIGFCILISGSICISQNQNVQKKDFQSALSSGDIKLTITGIDDGMKLSVKVDKKNDNPLVLYVPKDTSEIKIGSINYQKISISTQKEIKIDLSVLKEQSLLLNQVSKQKLIKGTIIIDCNEGKTTYQYQDATLGVK
jgi:hypothetical protein